MTNAPSIAVVLAAIGLGCGGRSLGQEDGSSPTTDAESMDPGTGESTTVSAAEATEEGQDLGSATCDYDCQGGDCVDGRCRPVFVADGLVVGAEGLTADATSAYWIHHGQGFVADVRRVSLAGGTVESLSADPLPYWGLLVSDATHLYYASDSIDQVAALHALSKDGAEVSEIPVEELWGSVYGLSRAGEWLYWVADHTPLFPEGDAEVGRVSLADGTVERVAFVWNSSGPLAASATEAYWANDLDIHRWEPATNTVEDVLADEDYTRHLVFRGRLLCWITRSAVSCADLDAGQRWTLASIGEPDHYALKLVLDDAHVFWPDQGPYGIRMAPLHGGDVEILVETASLPRSLIATDETLLWIEGDELWRVAKPPPGL
jgi:hypothetical protein